MAKENLIWSSKHQHLVSLPYQLGKNINSSKRFCSLV